MWRVDVEYLLDPPRGHDLERVARGLDAEFGARSEAARVGGLVTATDDQGVVFYLDVAVDRPDVAVAEALELVRETLAGVESPLDPAVPSP